MAQAQKTGMNGDIFAGGQKANGEARKTTIIVPGPRPQKLPDAAPKYPGRTNQLQPLVACVKYGDGMEVIHMLENHAADRLITQIHA